MSALSIFTLSEPAIERMQYFSGVPKMSPNIMIENGGRDAQIFWGHFGDISATPQTTAKNFEPETLLYDLRFLRRPRD